MDIERVTPAPRPVAYRQQRDVVDDGFVPQIRGLNVVGDVAAIEAFRYGTGEVIVQTGTLSDGRPAIRVRLAEPAERRVTAHLGPPPPRTYSPRRPPIVTAELTAGPAVPERRVQEGGWGRLPAWAKASVAAVAVAAVAALAWGVVSLILGMVAWLTANAAIAIGVVVGLAVLLGGTPFGRSTCTTIIKITHRH